jgi:hypothetical protein
MPYVSLDGGQTWKDIENVRIQVGNIDCDNRMDLLLNCTHEGVVFDVTKSHHLLGDEVVATRSRTYEEIAAQMLDDAEYEEP